MSKNTLKIAQNLVEIAPYVLTAGTEPLKNRKRLLRSALGDWQADGTKWFSQDGQDYYFVNELFKGQKGGFFVEIGASDGVTFSNTLALERHYGWDGICVEPHPEIFKKLAVTRSAECINAAASDQEEGLEFLALESDDVTCTMLSGFTKFMKPDQVERIKNVLDAGGAKSTTIEVPSRNIPELLVSRNQTSIDLLCIDIEGAEWKILQGFLRPDLEIKAICIENNGMHYRIAYELQKWAYRLKAIRGADEIYQKENI